MTSITHSSFYNVTCKICDVIRKGFIVAFIAMVGFAESTARARAARELANMGLYEEAKEVMMYRSKK